MKEVKQKKEKLSIADHVGRAVDTTIGIFAPGYAFRRRAFRYASGEVTKLSSYRGSKKSRLRSGWLPGGGSADEDLLPELPDMRERQRDLNRNDAHASGITNTMSTNVIGTGIKPQSRIDSKSLGITEEQATEFQQSAERAWKKWCPFADVTGRMDFLEIQRLVDLQILENGEAIILPTMLHNVQGRPFDLALDLVESDRLATPRHLLADKSIRSGVKIGSRGEAVSYFIQSTHPGDTLLKDSKKKATYREIPAYNEAGRKNVLHIYWINRPGQTRGIPFFSPVMNYFKDLADYMEAELVAARIAACFALFVQKEDPAAAMNAMSNKTDAEGNRLEEISPGIIEYLAPGESISTFSPQRPGFQFDPFVGRILRAISTALGLPYELVAKDFSKTNYSSMRASLLEARRFFKTRQSFLSRKFNQPVWDMVMEEAFLRGMIKPTDFFGRRFDWCNAEWIAQGWDWIDPVREVKAAREAVSGNLSTLADETAARGRDINDVLAQRKKEIDLMKELGVPESTKRIVSTQIIKKVDEDGNETEERDTEDGETEGA